MDCSHFLNSLGLEMAKNSWIILTGDITDHVPIAAVLLGMVVGVVLVRQIPLRGPSEGVGPEQW